MDLMLVSKILCFFLAIVFCLQGFYFSWKQEYQKATWYLVLATFNFLMLKP